jgi:hypothetical protein
MKIKRKIGLASLAAFAAAVGPAVAASPSATPADQRNEIHPFHVMKSKFKIQNSKMP